MHLFSNTLHLYLLIMNVQNKHTDIIQPVHSPNILKRITFFCNTSCYKYRYPNILPVEKTCWDTAVIIRKFLFFQEKVNASRISSTTGHFFNNIILLWVQIFLQMSIYNQCCICCVGVNQFIPPPETGFICNPWLSINKLDFYGT